MRSLHPDSDRPQCSEHRRALRGRRRAAAAALAAIVALALAGCGGGDDDGPPLGAGNTTPIAHPLPLAAIDHVISAQLAIDRDCGHRRGDRAVHESVTRLLEIDRRHPRGHYRPNPGDPPRGMRSVLTVEARALRSCGARREAQRLERRLGS